MNFVHKPVMPHECLDGLQIKKDGIYVDGTMGGAGHSKLICEKLSSNGTFIGIDRDSCAIETAKERLKGFQCKKIFAHTEFSNIENVLSEHEIAGLDGALLDIGVSSYQLDTAERGFSYMTDAPLDMRMNQDDVIDAAYVINEYSEKRLEQIIREYGEERWAKRIAKFICEKRSKSPIKGTAELVGTIKAAIPKAVRREGHHPAKKTFQAIRIEVNGELEELKKSVDSYIDSLNSGGRLCIITFHSLEDRIVKEKFYKRENPCECPKEFPVCVCGRIGDVVRITKKPIQPSSKEVEENPRSRSAKLRIVEKI